MKTNTKDFTLVLIILFLSCIVPLNGFSQLSQSSVVEKISGNKYYIHTVVKGQTLYSIAKLYDRNVSDVVMDNPTLIDGIRIGEKLKISVTKKETAIFKKKTLDTANFVFHRVQRKETLYSIAKKYGLTVEELQKFNPETKTSIRAGQDLIVAKKLRKKAVVAAPIQSGHNEQVNLSEAYGYEGELKRMYNVAFFLPFHAKATETMTVESILRGTESFHSKTKIALQFYEGALLALENLKQKGLNARVFVYDVDANIDEILKKPEMVEMDLIIGPLYASSFKAASYFAKRHSIAIVSPFIQANKILYDNSFVCKAMSSTTLQVVQMANYVADNFHENNVILLNSAKEKEQPFCNVFKKIYKQTSQNKLYPESPYVKESNRLEQLDSLLDSNRVNVLILPSNDQSYVTQFINKLNSYRSNHKIVLFGLQKWMKFDNLDIEYLNEMSLHVVSNNYINYSDEETKKFIEKFQSTYNTEPALYAYNGYDLTHFFAGALLEYGGGFLNDISGKKHHGVVSDFQFVKSGTSSSGHENKFVFILKYKDYELVSAN